MVSHQYQVTIYRAGQLQKLRNVRIHSPSIVQIISGSKRFFWQDAAIDISRSTLLLCEACASLSFENLPDKGRFLSRVFSFNCLPPESMLELSMKRATTNLAPILDADHALQETLHALVSFDLNNMSGQTQVFWLMGLYQQLAERGALHHLFASTHTTFRQKLSHYLSHTPGDEHPLDTVAERFAMSRATLIRKLKQEGTAYREVLVEVRLNHALYLMQNGNCNVATLAHMCGYQSESRFGQRFKARFGLTPSGYLKTLTPFSSPYQANPSAR